MRFTKIGLDQHRWGSELGEYLEGDALVHWIYLKDTGADMADWARLKRDMLQRFCTTSRAALIRQIAANQWHGDHQTYSANFAKIVARGAEMPATELVEYFMANLPLELCRVLTKGATVKFTDWREVAAELAAVEGPWGAAEEVWRRRRSELRLSLGGRTTRAHRLPADEGARERLPPAGSNDSLVCFACKGKGHLSTDCPSRDEKIRRPGETCKRCGGEGHYARDCATYPKPRQGHYEGPKGGTRTLTREHEQGLNKQA